MATKKKQLKKRLRELSDRQRVSLMSNFFLGMAGWAAGQMISRGQMQVFERPKKPRKRPSHLRVIKGGK